MYNNQDRQSIKLIPITSYLASKGIMPVLENGGEYCYFSPFREERTPSFFVNTAKNLYHDFAGEGGGDNLKLVMRIDSCDFIAASKILMAVDQSFEIELQTNLPASPQYQSFIKRVSELKHHALVSYLTYERKIPVSIGKKYVSEIHYTTSKGDFFSMGFKNESGGYELRNKSFKGCIGKKDISIRGSVIASNAAIFEGFIDFMSFLSRHPVGHENTKFFILNSVSLINRLPDLSDFEYVSMYLDNDEAGEKAALLIAEKYSNAWNASKVVFPSHSDYNEYLIAYTNDKTAKN